MLVVLERLMEEASEQPAAVPGMTNVAIRVHRIFSSLGPGPGPDHIWRAFARAFGTTTDDDKLGPILVGAAHKRLLDQIDLLAEKLNALHRLSPETRERPLKELRRIVTHSAAQPMSSWQSFGGNLRSDLLQTLLMWGQMLKEDEPEIVDEELRAAREAVAEARSAVQRDGSLPDEMRRILLHLLGLLEHAIDGYAIGGVEEAKEKLRSFFVAWHAAASPIHDHGSSQGMRAFSTAIRKAGAFIRTVVVLDELYQASTHAAELAKPVMLLLGHDSGGG
jgi:hypothetical protein